MNRTEKGFGFVSYTDERMVIDFPLAGFKAADVKVSIVDAEDIVGRYVKVRASRKREVNADSGKLPIKVGFDHVCPEDVKENVEVRDDFDITKAAGSFKNGLLRIEIPLFERAVGKDVALT